MWLIVSFQFCSSSTIWHCWYCWRYHHVSSPPLFCFVCPVCIIIIPLVWWLLRVLYSVVFCPSFDFFLPLSFPVPRQQRHQCVIFSLCFCAVLLYPTSNTTILYYQYYRPCHYPAFFYAAAAIFIFLSFSSFPFYNVAMFLLLLCLLLLLLSWSLSCHCCCHAIMMLLFCCCCFLRLVFFLTFGVLLLCFEGAKKSLVVLVLLPHYSLSRPTTVLAFVYTINCKNRSERCDWFKSFRVFPTNALVPMAWEKPGFCPLPSISWHRACAFCTRHKTWQLAFLFGISRQRHFTWHKTWQSTFLLGIFFSARKMPRYNGRSAKSWFFLEHYRFKVLAKKLINSQFFQRPILANFTTLTITLLLEAYTSSETNCNRNFGG